MQKAVVTMIVGFLLVFSAALEPTIAQSTRPSTTVTWPTHGWPTATPASVGLDEKVLTEFDADLAGGKYMMVDSFQVFRCGKEVFSRKYAQCSGCKLLKNRLRAAGHRQKSSKIVL